MATLAAKRTHCRVCRRRVGPEGETRFTRTGAHLTCAIIRAREAAEQMQARSGEHYDKWRQSMVAVAERVS